MWRASPSAGRPLASPTGKSESLARELEASIVSRGGRAWAGQCNVAEENDVLAFVDQAVKALGPVDVLVNNAGMRRDANVVLLSKARWNEILDVNLTGAYHAVRAVVRGMLLRQWGRIINVSSPSARMPLPGQTGYAASKAGLDGFTRALSRDLAPKGVLVNCCVTRVDRDRVSRVDAARGPRYVSQNGSGRPSRHDRRKWRRWSPSWRRTPQATSPGRSSELMVDYCDE